jgi:hypothetical protein
MASSGESVVHTENNEDTALARAEAEIERTRERLIASAMTLQRELGRASDWREWVRRKPGLTLALAFGIGVLIGRRG